MDPAVYGRLIAKVHRGSQVFLVAEDDLGRIVNLLADLGVVRRSSRYLLR